MGNFCRTQINLLFQYAHTRHCSFSKHCLNITLQPLLACFNASKLPKIACETPEGVTYETKIISQASLYSNFKHLYESNTIFQHCNCTSDFLCHCSYANISTYVGTYRHYMSYRITNSKIVGFWTIIDKKKRKLDPEVLNDLDRYVIVDNHSNYT